MLQNAEARAAKAEFPVAESSTFESPESEPEIEVESPQCVADSVSETPLTEAVAGAACESPDDQAESADDLSKASPAAPGQAAIGHTQAAAEVCFRFAALLSQYFAFVHMH